MRFGILRAKPMKTARSILIALSLAVLITGCRTATKKRAPTTKPATQPQSVPLTQEQRQKELDSFDFVWTTIRDRHFDPKYNGVDWEKARVELRPKVEN